MQRLRVFAWLVWKPGLDFAVLEVALAVTLEVVEAEVGLEPLLL